MRVLKYLKNPKAVAEGALGLTGMMKDLKTTITETNKLVDEIKQTNKK